jgi:hypothetical protein
MHNKTADGKRGNYHRYEDEPDREEIEKLMQYGAANGCEPEVASFLNKTKGIPRQTVHNWSIKIAIDANYCPGDRREGETVWTPEELEIAMQAWFQ